MKRPREEKEEKEKKKQKIVAPINEVLNLKTVDPNTLFMMDQWMEKEGFNEHIFTDLIHLSVFPDEIYKEYLKQNTSTKNKEGEELYQVENINLYTLEQNKEIQKALNNNEIITVDKEKIDKSIHIENNTNIELIEEVIEVFPPIIEKNMEPGKIIKENTNEESNLEKTQKIMEENPQISQKESAKAVEKLVDKGVFINIDPQNPAKKKKRNYKNLQKTVDKLEITTTLKTYLIQPINKELPIPNINPNKAEYDAPYTHIRVMFNNLGVRCNLKMAKLLKDGGLLKKYNIFKICCQATLAQHNRFHKSRSKKKLRSHPVITKRLVLSLILLMTKNKEIYQSALRNIVIGYRGNQYEFRKYNAADASISTLPNLQKHVDIENYFSEVRKK